MRAIVWTRYGPPEGLRLEEIPEPTPDAREIRVRVFATTAAAGDCELRALRFSFGLRLLVRLLMGPLRPRNKVLGQEFSGVVDAVGRAVSRFRVGDPVFGTTGFRFGAYADYVCLPESSPDAALTGKPTRMTFEEAAAVPTGGLEALHFLRRAGDLADRRVLIVGAGGGIGTFAIQLAKFFGAHVTAVDREEKREAMLSVGADRVLDFAREDYTAGAERYDVVFDVVGKSPYAETLAILAPRGVYLLGNPNLRTMMRGFWTSRTTATNVKFGAAKPTTEDLEFLRGLIESGRVRSLIDRRFPLERMVDAHRYVDTGSALGKVVITVSPGSDTTGGSSLRGAGFNRV